MTDDTFDYGRFDALTFDCYGTLIDWEAGLTTALRALLDPHGVTPDGEALLETYASHEAAGERPPYRRYRDVLAEAARATCAAYGVVPTADALARSAGPSPTGRPSRIRTTPSRASRRASSSASSRTATTTCSLRRTRGSVSCSTGS